MKKTVTNVFIDRFLKINRSVNDVSDELLTMSEQLQQSPDRIIEMKLLRLRRKVGRLRRQEMRLAREMKIML